MIRFFRIHDPIRIIGLLAVLLLLRLPVILLGTPDTIPELKWLVIGERVADGYIYIRDVFDTTGPLSAAVYGLLNFLFGKSVVALQLFSLLLMLTQSLLFNRLIINNQSFNYRTYLPALLYIVLSSCFFDSLSLSPLHLGLTFLLLIVNEVFHLIRHGKSDSALFNTGLFTGLAILFYYPLTFFAPFPLVVLTLYAGMRARHVILVLYGLMFTLGLFALVSFVLGASGQLWFIFTFFIQNYEKVYYLTVAEFAGLYSVPLVLFALALTGIGISPLWVNYQLQARWVFLIWFLAAALGFHFSSDHAPYQALVFLPPFAFFISGYMIEFRKNKVPAILLSILLAYAAVTCWGTLLVPQLRFEGMADYTLDESSLKDELEGQKILVLSREDLGLYRNNSLASPYLNIQLAKRSLSPIDTYSKALKAYGHFSSDMPEYIIDREGILESLFEKVLLMDTSYVEVRPGVFELK